MVQCWVADLSPLCTMVWLEYGVAQLVSGYFGEEQERDLQVQAILDKQSYSGYGNEWCWKMFFLILWIMFVICCNKNAMDGSSDYERVFKEIEEHRICIRKALLYESFALFLEVKGRLIDACMIYHLGISRNAEPLGRLKKAQVLFLERMSERVTNGSFQKMKNDISVEDGENFINPWSVSTLKNLLQKMNSKVVEYEGYHSSNKAYPGKVALSSLQKSAKNKDITIGRENYQIRGRAGQGGFAQVFKAYVDGQPDDVVARKIQKPPFPWEFYMYRQLDIRIPEKEKSFGFAHRLHLYSDYSVIVSDYFAHGTLQDAMNCNVVTSGSMDEVLCIYYTIEMLQILETLHGAAMIHGDFKPDNLLIRYSRLTAYLAPVAMLLSMRQLEECVMNLW
ncbi:mitotic checkpoint serine/threonine-protein kinase BUB1-like [Salvia miltiorrhiza]|uniref:mitotic checkpoint serine/threonine-protein kinase BUB1-like n=1 Tax=Salvia miltiorrhiza TaxID=226208 RepID=UPI0025ACE62C|nr:mitotic checkpoint serine/threonine-protein kinase BUB1-like [Salvia miltiorrhiza]